MTKTYRTGGTRGRRRRAKPAHTVREAIERYQRACAKAAAELDARDRTAARALAALSDECRETCAHIAAAIGAAALHEGAARLFRWPRSAVWLVVTRGDHEHPFAALETPDGRALGVVLLVRLADELGTWRTWGASLVLPGETRAARGVGALERLPMPLLIGGEKQEGDDLHGRRDTLARCRQLAR
jgi:hypothetical protein